MNNPTLGEFCFTMIGRADIEGSKSNVAMNAWLPQASSCLPTAPARSASSFFSFLPPARPPALGRPNKRRKKKKRTRQKRRRSRTRHFRLGVGLYPDGSLQFAGSARRRAHVRARAWRRNTRGSRGRAASSYRCGALLPAGMARTLTRLRGARARARAPCVSSRTLACSVQPSHSVPGLQLMIPDPDRWGCYPSAPCVSGRLHAEAVLLPALGTHRGELAAAAARRDVPASRCVAAAATASAAASSLSRPRARSLSQGARGGQMGGPAARARAHAYD